MMTLREIKRLWWGVNVVLKEMIGKSYGLVNRGVLLLALLIFLLFVGWVLPGESRRSHHYFGDSPVPDTSFIYSGEQLYEMAEDFGWEGRRYYIRSRFTFDVAWPVAYGFFLWAAIAFFGKPFKTTVCRWTLLLPIGGVLLDLFENIGVVLVMLAYPEKISGLLLLVPFFTLSKWLVIGASFAALLVMMAAYGIRRVKTRLSY